MRFWSLKTFRSIRFQGSVFHSSIGLFPVVITYKPLLARLSSMSSGLRQRIPGVTQGICFLGHPTPRSHAVDTYSGVNPGEWTVRYSVPELRLSLRLGSYYSPGYFGMHSGSARELSSLPDFSVGFTVSVLDQAGSLRRPVIRYDDSDIGSSS